MNDSTATHLDEQSPAFLKAWDDYVATCQTLFERLADPAATKTGGAAPPAFLGHWKDFAASLGMRSGFAAEEHFKPQDMFASFSPAIGYTREYQEIARRMLDLTGRFHRRYSDFVQQSADIAQSALHAILRRSASDAEGLHSPAAIYDAWIDSAEEAYALAAHGEPFARLLADLCNILSEFKIERGKLLEALARQLDWPSRAEVDSLHRQVRSLTATAAKAGAAAKSTAVPAARSRTARKTKPKTRKTPPSRTRR